MVGINGYTPLITFLQIHYFLYSRGILKQQFSGRLLRQRSIPLISKITIDNLQLHIFNFGNKSFIFCKTQLWSDGCRCLRSFSLIIRFDELFDFVIVFITRPWSHRCCCDVTIITGKWSFSENNLLACLMHYA